MACGICGGPGGKQHGPGHVPGCFRFAPTYRPVPRELDVTRTKPSEAVTRRRNLDREVGEFTRSADGTWIKLPGRRRC